MKKECKDRIEDLRKDFMNLRKVFVALGDETRQLILLVLLEHEPNALRVNEIAQYTYLSRPAVSHHLQILKETGILQMRREGTKNYYSIYRETPVFKQIKEMFEKIEKSI